MRRIIMPESRKDAEARAEKDGFPKSNVICLDGDDNCYIAPHGITLAAAKRAYAEARNSGDDKETAAKKAWAVQKNIEESRNMDNKIEQRSITRQAQLASEVRAIDESGKKLIVRGYAILFNNPTKIRDTLGEYEEVILPSALDKTDLTDVYLLGGHNPDNLLGRAGKNLRLEADKTGLFFECELPNTQLARDYYNLTESGILDGTSFGFTTRDEVNFKGKREVRQIDRLFEITLTPFPAYSEASVVAVRSKQEEPKKLTIAEALKQIKEIE